MGAPLEAVRDLGAGQGRKRGRKRTRKNDRFWHVARGAETSDRGWWEAGLEDIQVDGVPRRERGWGAGDTESATTTNGYLWGAVGGREGVKENDPETFETGGASGVKISVKY